MSIFLPENVELKKMGPNKFWVKKNVCSEKVWSKENHVDENQSGKLLKYKAMLVIKNFGSKNIVG